MVGREISTHDKSENLKTIKLCSEKRCSRVVIAEKQVFEIYRRAASGRKEERQ